MFRSIPINPVEHLQTIQSGIPTQDWDNVTQFRPTWVPRNDSMKGQYAGSVHEDEPGFTKILKRGVGVYDYRKADVRISLSTSARVYNALNRY